MLQRTSTLSSTASGLVNSAALAHSLLQCKEMHLAIVNTAVLCNIPSKLEYQLKISFYFLEKKKQKMADAEYTNEEKISTEKESI